MYTFELEYKDGRGVSFLVYYVDNVQIKRISSLYSFFPSFIHFSRLQNTHKFKPTI